MKKCLCLIIFLLAISFISANSIEYQIIDKKVLVEINIDSKKSLEFPLPYNYRVLEVNKEYELKENTLIIPDAKNLSIKYITEAPIERSSDKIFFVVDRIYIPIKKVVLKLPEEAVLTEDYLIFPKNYSLQTDGRKIIIKWDDPKELQILVSYKILKNQEIYLYLIIISLILIIFYSYREIILKNKLKNLRTKIYQKDKNKKTSSAQIDKEVLKKSLTKNLFEDEKKIIEYLIDKKDNECWTKEIVKELNISKVRLSRKLRSLAQKELIKKIPFGNENRIRLIKS